MARALRFTATETTRARARVGLPALPQVARYGWALLAIQGEMSYPSVLSARTYGFHDAVMRGNALRYPRAFRRLPHERRVRFQVRGRRYAGAERGGMRLSPAWRPMPYFDSLPVPLAA